MIEHSVNINGIEVAAQYSDQAVNGIFIPLLRKLTGMQRTAGRRILVMLAAPPGAGKSTLLSFLNRLSERKDVARIQNIGMDGFHRRQEYLLSHWTERAGKQIRMVEIKGAPETFDLEHLSGSVKRVAAGETIGWPVYDRMLHNPIEDAVRIDGDIVLLEGNYLLLNEEGWQDLSSFADYTVSIRADEKLLRTRLIDRRIKTGVAEKAAVRFVDFSDMPNVRLCLYRSKPANLQLELDERGDFHICVGDEENVR